MKKIIIFIDGGARGNPGPAAIGVVFCNEKGAVLKKFSHFLGHKTNNEAEYHAAIFALEKLKALLGKKLCKVTEVEIRSDSQLLVFQMQKKYKILEKELQPLFVTLWNLTLDFKKVTFKLISRNKNKDADALVKETLDSIDTQRSIF